MFKQAVSRDQVRPDEILKVEIDGEEIALYEVNGKILATTNICPHAYCFLHENGVVYGENVECSCHGSTFKIETGENVNPPSSEPLQTFPTAVRDGEVFVDATPLLAAQASLAGPR